MSSVKKLASQTAVYGLHTIIGRLVVWMLTPLYTSQMIPAEYGVFSELYVFTSYLLIIMTFGMETAFFRFGMEEKDAQKSYSHSFIFVGLMGGAFMLVFGYFYEWFALILGYEGRENLVLMMITITFLDVIMALPMAKLRHDEQPLIFSSVSLFSVLLTVILNIYFYKFLEKENADYVFIANLIASGAKFGIICLLALPLSKWIKQKDFFRKFPFIFVHPSSWKIDKKLMKSMLGFGFFIMLAGLSGIINQNSDVNFIKRVWGELPQMFQGELRTGNQLVGLYAASKKLAIPILLVTQAFRYAAEPFFFKHAKDSDSKIVFAKVLHYFVLAALVVFLLISSFAFELVSTDIFGIHIIDKRFWPGLEIVPLLSFAFILWGTYINLSIWFKITGQVRFGLLFSLCGTAIIILLNLLLIPFIGYFGSAIAMLFCYGVMCSLVYFVGQKYYPIPYRMGRLAMYTIWVLIAFGINFQLGQTEIFSAVFWNKFLICTLCLGSLYVMERMKPAF